MAIEIEHKYKVINDSYISLITKELHIIQGYISRDKNRTVRVRLCDDEGYITIKGLTTNDTRSEFEYKIPANDAKTMLNELCVKPLIDKTRNIVMFDGNRWEIDVFHSELEGLIIAEIEIPYSEYQYSLPPFLGENVTNNPLYYNSNIGNQ
ncbi:MAG: CYTH domain-containing protein [Muribaculaceae bacterium]